MNDKFLRQMFPKWASVPRLLSGIISKVPKLQATNAIKYASVMDLKKRPLTTSFSILLIRINSKPRKNLCLLSIKLNTQ